MNNAPSHNFDGGEIYLGGFVIAGFISAIAIWIYSFYEWGLLLGLIFGWIPALIGGVIIGALWPLAAAILIWIYVSSDGAGTDVSSFLQSL